MPRIVTLEYDQTAYKAWRFGNNLDRPDATFYAGVSSRTAAPVALSVCRESRELALEKYHLSFGSRSTPPTTWVNFEIDTVYFDTEFVELGGGEAFLHWLAMLNEKEKNKLKYLGLSIVFADTSDDQVRTYNQALKIGCESLSNLKEFAFVVDTIDYLRSTDELLRGEIESFHQDPKELHGWEALDETLAAVAGLFTVDRIIEWLEVLEFLRPLIKCVYGRRLPPDKINSERDIKVSETDRIGDI